MAKTLADELGAAKPNKQLERALETIFSRIDELDDFEARDLLNQILVQFHRGDDAAMEIELAIEPLNEAFQAYRRSGPGRNKNVLEWLATTKSVHIRDFFKVATAVDLNDLQKVYRLSKNRLIDLRNVSRPKGYERFYESVTRILGDSDDELARLLDVRLQDLEALREFRKTGKLPEPLFWRYKGRITELLAEPMKQDILRAARAEKPNATRFEGLRADTALTKSGDRIDQQGYREIWDGIVGEDAKGEFRIYDIIEIKSGRYGHDEGTEQVIATYQTRFTSYGDQLRVPQSDGSLKVYSKAPGRQGPGLVNDSQARFHVIAPAGTSRVMPEQRLLLEDDRRIDVLTLMFDEHPVSHSELDALILDFLTARAW